MILTLLAFMCAVAAASDGQSGVALICLAPAVLFGSIWFYKHWRDTAIISRAHEQRARQQHQATQPLKMIQTVTSKRNGHGLFVPPPLD
jgi:hypothetical protein